MVSLGSGQVTADISGSVETTINAVSIVSAVNSTSGNTTVATVGAGKIWKILGFNISSAGNVIITITGGGTTYHTCYGDPTRAERVGGFGNTYFDTLTAGETIVKNNSAAVGSCITVFYIEETAP